nr:PREDICTED: uncharacterized protein LOC109031122 [Bemisia tabaci]
MAQPLNDKMEVDIENKAAVSDSEFETKKNRDLKENHAKHKISSLDIQTFCDHLEKFVLRAQRFRKKISGYPLSLQQRFNNDLRNLEFLFIETKDTVRNIQKIKTQHTFVKKDLGNTQRILKKLKQEEIREIEDKISRCDANCYKVWETLKRSKNVEGLRKFSIDLQEKCAALEHLKGLVNKMLNETPETPLALIQFHSPHAKLHDKSVKSLTYEARKFSRPLRSKKRKQPDPNDVFLTIEDNPLNLPSLPMGPVALSLTNSMVYSMSELSCITASSHSLANTIASSTNRNEMVLNDNMQTVLDALFNNLKEENDGQYAEVTEGPANFNESANGFDYINYDLNFL